MVPVEEVHLARSAGYSATGNMYLGKVVRVIPGMQAAFVDIGLERPGFLHASDIARPLVATATATDSAKGKRGIRDLLHDGQELLVQVERDPIGAKGARLSTNLALASKYLVLMPKGRSGRSFSENYRRKRTCQTF
jgi:ribonuclease G